MKSIDLIIIFTIILGLQLTQRKAHSSQFWDAWQELLVLEKCKANLALLETCGLLL